MGGGGASTVTLSIEDYQVPLEDRPNLDHNAYDARSDSIPCLDLSTFRGLQGDSRKVKLEEMRKAVSEWGFFQVYGHNVDQELVNQTMEWAVKMFQLPAETKKQAGVSAGSPAGYLLGGTDVDKIWQEAVLSWADPEDFKIVADKLWSDKEECEKARDLHYKFSIAMEELALDIFNLLEEAVGVREKGFSDKWERIKKTFIRINHYPVCERPDLVLGANSHTDPSLISILLQDDVGGLQILKDGQWIACKPLAGCFMVNIGDCVQVLSNDIFPSVQHRVNVNKSVSRYSIAAFAFPKAQIEMSPLSELVDDEQHPAKFKPMTFEKLVTASRQINYKGKQVLSAFRV